jgi:hypothetical protein
MARIFSGCFVFSLFTSCAYRDQYFLSPQNANSNPYHAIPMKADSLDAATFASAVFFSGSANDAAADHISGFQGNLHRSNQFSVFQAYYGANLTLGAYHISDYYHHAGGYMNTGTFDSVIHVLGSGNFFGSYGVSGGINLVVTHQHIKLYRHAEWRILGIETSLQNEFGQYANRRDKIPDSLANIIYRRHFSSYLGLYTEWMWTNKHKTEVGFKLALGEDLNPGSSYTSYYAKSILPLYCFSITYHVTKERFTGFIQLNLGTYATNFQTGLSYRLGKK